MDHYRDAKKEDARFRSLINNIGANSFKVEDKEVVDFLVLPCPPTFFLLLSSPPYFVLIDVPFFFV